MAHKDLELSKLAGCYGYAYSLEAYNRHFQTISSVLKKNQLWYKIGCWGGGQQICFTLENIMCLQPCSPTPDKHIF